MHNPDSDEHAPAGHDSQRLPDPPSFHEILSDLIIAEDVEAAVLALLQACVVNSGAKYGALFVYEPREQSLRYHLSVGVPHELDQAQRARRPWRLGEEQGLVGLVASSGQPLYLADVRADVRWTGRSANIQSALWVPLKIGKDLYGVFNILSGRVDGLSEHGRSFAAGTARYASLILERRRHRQELEDALRRERLLAIMTRQIEEASDPGVVAHIGMEHLLAHSEFDHAMFFTTDEQGVSRMVDLAGHFPPPLQQLLVRGLSPGVGGTGVVVQTQEPLYVPEYAQFPNAVPEFVEAGVRSTLNIPLKDHGRVFGVLVMGSIGRQVHMPDVLKEWMQALVARIGNAYAQARAFHEVQENREAALAVIGRAMELRDYETQGHTERVTSWAVRMVERITADPAMIRAVRWGALLHDVGKLALADTILLKPGPLTPEERKRMEQHPIWGEQMLRHLTFLPPETLAVVRHHHERWDGQGYPDRLAGQAIPLGARLFAVVDTYDALVSVRPYKSAWAPEAARQYLLEQAGRQFDREMVELFLGVLDQSGTPLSGGGAAATAG